MATYSSFTFIDSVFRRSEPQPGFRNNDSAIGPFIVAPIAIALTPITFALDIITAIPHAMINKFVHGRNSNCGEILYNKLVVSPIQHFVFTSLNIWLVTTVTLVAYQVALLAAPILLVTPLSITVALLILSAPTIYRGTRWIAQDYASRNFSIFERPNPLPQNPYHDYAHGHANPAPVQPAPVQPAPVQPAPAEPAHDNDQDQLDEDGYPIVDPANLVDVIVPPQFEEVDPATLEDVAGEPQDEEVDPAASEDATGEPQDEGQDPAALGSPPQNTGTSAQHSENGQSVPGSSSQATSPTGATSTRIPDDKIEEFIANAFEIIMAANKNNRLFNFDNEIADFGDKSNQFTQCMVLHILISQNGDTAIKQLIDLKFFQETTPNLTSDRLMERIDLLQSKVSQNDMLTKITDALFFGENNLEGEEKATFEEFNKISFSFTYNRAFSSLLQPHLL